MAESRYSFNNSFSETVPGNHEDIQLAAWAILSNSHLCMNLASIAREVSVCTTNQNNVTLSRPLLTEYKTCRREVVPEAHSNSWYLEHSSTQLQKQWNHTRSCAAHYLTVKNCAVSSQAAKPSFETTLPHQSTGTTSQISSV